MNKKRVINYRINEELAVRSLIIPNKQKHPHSFLRFVLEQFSQIQIPASGQRPRRLSHQPHLMVNRPPHDVDQMVGLDYRVAYILPALLLLEHPLLVQPDLRQHPRRNMRVLI